MATYFITRHPGAVEWARQRGVAAEVIPHLMMSRIHPGDLVLGTLPVNLIAEVNERQARYQHLTMAIPATARGTDLTADDMERFGAELVEYRAERVPCARNKMLCRVVIPDA